MKYATAGLAGLVLLAVSACSSGEASMMETRESAEAASGPVSFSALHGWQEDDHAAALAAFRRSCARILELDGAAPLDPKASEARRYGTAADWQEACAAANKVGSGKEAARRYFETWFQPVRIGNASEVSPLFTGYFEPVMKGSLTRHGPYQTPIITFPPEYAAARAAGKELPTRSQIEASLADGRLDAKRLALVWLADPVDAFFLHIQGSGRIHLDNGGVMRLAFSAKNNRPYLAIGKVLIERGEISKDEISMQTIRAWLEAHPAEVKPLLSRNDSYIFFKRLEGAGPDAGPPGAEKVSLTPGRSLAVDRSFHPLGSLLWLDSRYPAPDGSGYRPLRRLMVAQDTGSAIRGEQRGDVFWGATADAAEIAGRMKEPGELIALLPKSLAAR
ncbi:MltA domain-containing protein [Parvibaculum sp.]|uniref:murein transglycosylase A n=1 Tax=Parvibaculum sp. TaxID=2024848 RepID=UPI00320CCCC9